jgi:hypothetical protein
LLDDTSIEFNHFIVAHLNRDSGNTSGWSKPIDPLIPSRAWRETTNAAIKKLAGDDFLCAE